MNQLAYSRLVNTSLSQPGRATQSDREHHLVLELILEKGGDSAEHVMGEHVRASRRAAGGAAHRRLERHVRHGRCLIPGSPVHCATSARRQWCRVLWLGPVPFRCSGFHTGSRGSEPASGELSAGVS
ncbi:hypothetical protein ABZZ80_27140 [Streptomyces sp. NPDC006356]